MSNLQNYKSIQKYTHSNIEQKKWDIQIKIVNFYLNMLVWVKILKVLLTSIEKLKCSCIVDGRLKTDIFMNELLSLLYIPFPEFTWGNNEKLANDKLTKTGVVFLI